MALWGTRDSFSVTGTVDVSNTVDTTTVAGTGTAFNTEVNVGDALVIAGKRRKVTAVGSATALTIGTAWDGANQTGATITGQDVPKYVTAAEIASNNIIGVDDTEASIAANKARGINTPGWTKYVTYTDMHGNTRYKTEPLVVMSSAVTSDAPDDTIGVPDAVITILTQPSNSSAASGNAVSFTVSASVDPTSATILYRWEEDSGSGFAALNNGGVYANVSTATLNISNNALLTGNIYRVQLSAAGVAANTVSANATLTVV
jgi:hypothetical protein